MSSLAPDAPTVWYVTDRQSLPEQSGLIETARASASAGVDFIQIREKDLSARALANLFFEISAATAAAPNGSPQILVNDRLDVALAAGASGVHLTSASAPIADMVRWCRHGHAPVNFKIGISCHSLEEGLAADRAGANYIFFGPVFATPSKRVFGAPQGIDALALVCRAVAIPVIAIGGIESSNLDACLAAGAAGIAAIRLFQEPEDPSNLAHVVARVHSARSSATPTPQASAPPAPSFPRDRRSP